MKAMRLTVATALAEEPVRRLLEVSRHVNPFVDVVRDFIALDESAAGSLGQLDSVLRIEAHDVVSHRGAGRAGQSDAHLEVLDDTVLYDSIVRVLYVDAVSVWLIRSAHHVTVAVEACAIGDTEPMASRAEEVSREGDGTHDGGAAILPVSNRRRARQECTDSRRCCQRVTCVTREYAHRVGKVQMARVVRARRRPLQGNVSWTAGQTHRAVSRKRE